MRKKKSLVSSRTTYLGLVTLSVVILLLAACGGSPSQPGQTASPKLSGLIKLDGSSTVFPISEAMAEEFQKLHRDVKVTVGISGTGGGFKKFCNGETDISDASRPIKAPEIEACTRNNIQFIEIPVAFDGLSVMVNPRNTWVTSMTVAELKKTWEPDAQGKITRWNQIRPEWPDARINLYGPGTDSGTFDYFTGAVVGKEDASRGDYTPSEDDNVLVQGIAGDVNALGYFGYAFYMENKDKLKLVAIDGGNGPVLPSEQTINDGSYKPLSRPLFIYVRKDSADRLEIQEFIRFYITQAKLLVGQVGYIPLPDNIYQAVLNRFDKRITGTVYADALAGAKLEDLYRVEK